MPPLPGRTGSGGKYFGKQKIIRAVRHDASRADAALPKKELST